MLDGRTFELVVGIAKPACADGDAGDGDTESACYEAGDGRVGDGANVKTAKGGRSWSDGSDESAWKERHGVTWTS